MERLGVVVDSSDHLTRIALEHLLEVGLSGKVEILTPGEQARAHVLVHATHWFGPAVASRVRLKAVELDVPVVLVVDALDEGDLLATVRSRVVAVALRSTITADSLADHVVCAAAGGAVLPPDLLGTFLTQVRKIHRDLTAQRGVNELSLSQREVDVLRLLAEGHDTGEIGKRLSYSERTIKTVLSTVINRLGARNRAHAVASAIRSGVV
ncbi:helix-turn-helix transcriptional regulator [Streptomyces sp. CWNU-52B]|uniref:helix-turn-helix transcriptional regulator n=1 Tax=unclassified Streptomyces TaxID=2593676 RepID=UPI0039C12DAA